MAEGKQSKTRQLDERLRKYCLNPEQYLLDSVPGEKFDEKLRGFFQSYIVLSILYRDGVLTRC